MSQRKCKICGLPIEKEDCDSSVKYKNGYAHEKCFNKSISIIKKNADKVLKEKATDAVTRRKPAKKKTESDKQESKAKPKAELKGPMSEEEYKKKKSFFDYIRSYYNEDGKLPAKVYALSEKYIDQYGFTYESMHQTMIYIREIIEKDITGDGLGLLPYYKDEAEAYYKSLKQVEEANKNVDVNKMYEEKVVVIKPHKKKVKQLDITNIK